MSDKPKVTYLVNQDGETVKVPAESAQALVDAGYVGASEGQVRDARLQEKYGSTGQQIGTGLEAGAEALTLGASDYLEQGLGISSAKDIAGRESANPGAHAVGTGVGMVAPLVATLGGSAAVEGAGAAGTAARGLAEVSAPSVVGKIGGLAKTGVEGLVESGLRGGVEGPLSKGASLLAKTAGHAAQGATEGALYGTGQVVHEAALGDPNLTAQSAIAEIGLSGLLGGAIGSGAGVLGQLTGNIGATKIGEKLSGWLEDFEGERNIKAAGAIQSDINRTLKTTSKEELAKIGREARDLGLVDTFTTPASAAEKSAALMDSAGEKMGSLLDGADASGKAPKDIGAIVTRAKDEVLKDLEANPLEKGTANTVREALDAYEAKFAPVEGQEGGLGFRDLHGIRKQLDKKIYGLNGMMDPNATALKASLSDFRSIISDEINKGMEQAGLDSAAWKAANREYRVGATINKFAEKGMLRAHGNNLVSPTEMLSGAAGLIHGGPLGAAALGAATGAARRFASGALGTGARVMRGLLGSGAAEEVTGKTSEAIAAARQAGQDSLTPSASSAPESIGALAALQKTNQTVADRLDAAVLSLVRGGKLAGHIAGVVGHVAEESFEERSKRIQQMVASPEQGIGGLSKIADGLHDHAPQTSQALQMSSAQMVGTLAQSMPKVTRAGPLGPELKPSKTAIADWMQTYDVLNNPMLALAMAHKHTLTPKVAGLVQTHYPALHAKMMQSALHAATTHKATIPYSRKVMLSMLAGQPLDDSLSGKSILANQAPYHAPSNKSGEDATGPGALGKTTQTGLSKLNVGGSWSTPGQALSSRIRSGE